MLTLVEFGIITFVLAIIFYVVNWVVWKPGAPDAPRTVGFSFSNLMWVLLNGTVILVFFFMILALFQVMPLPFKIR